MYLLGTRSCEAPRSVFFSLKKLAYVKKKQYFCSAKVFEHQKFTNMEAALRQPVVQSESISEEKWNSLHTVDELDTALKTIIHNHFHA